MPACLLPIKKCSVIKQGCLALSAAFLYNTDGKNEIQIITGRHPWIKIEAL